MSSIINIGVDDHKTQLFEAQYPIPNGMRYNSYIIEDEKIAVLDTVDANFKDEWLNNLKNTLGDKKPSYLVIHHMEPDHSSIIQDFIDLYPDVEIVLSIQAQNILKQFFPLLTNAKYKVVKEGDELNLGEHTLCFYGAAMVHWPEVLLSYDKKDKVLFSADAFGTFGASDSFDDEWEKEARRYYFGIVGKYGLQVQNVLKKLANLEINTICSLHGPTLDSDINKYIEKYDIWSKYDSEEDAICIAYASVYGNTKAAAYLLKEELEKLNKKVYIHDLCNEDVYYALSDAFMCDKLVLASVTYDSTIFPKMLEFIEHLLHRNIQRKKIALIENGSWGPSAANNMKKLLDAAKDINILDNVITIKSKMNEANINEIKELANVL